jgi:hypothetical protein
LRVWERDTASARRAGSADVISAALTGRRLDCSRAISELAPPPAATDGLQAKAAVTKDAADGHGPLHGIEARVKSREWCRSSSLNSSV